MGDAETVDDADGVGRDVALGVAPAAEGLLSALVHAADDAEPAGAVAPLGHAVHAVAAPPAEKELAAQAVHTPALM